MVRLSKLFAVGSLLLPLFSGCAAVAHPAGESVTFKNSMLATVGLLGIALAFLVFGAGIARESYHALPKGKRSRKSSKSGKGRQPTPKWAGVMVGSGLTVIGGLILLLGVPSSLLAYVTVTPEKVVLRDQLLWFSTGPREIPFSSIAGIERVEEEVIARRGKRKKQYLFITHTGGTERIEMAMVHQAAWPRLDEMWRESQATGSMLAESGPQPGPTEGGGDSAVEAIASNAAGSPANRASGAMLGGNAPAASPPGVGPNDAQELTVLPGENPQSLRGRNGEVFRTRVVGSIAGNIFGSGPYTDDSSLAVAAVHAGVLRPGQIGIVVYRMLPGLPSYEGSERHGVRSNRWNEYQGSFEILTATPDAELANPFQPTAMGAGSKSTSTPSVDSLTPVERIGRYAPGIFVSAKGAMGYSRAAVVEVYAEGKVRIHFTHGPDSGTEQVMDLKDTIPAASAVVVQRGEGPGSEVTDVSQLKVGMRVLAHYDGEWIPAEVTALRGNRAEIRWEGEMGRHSVPLSWLRIP